MGEKARPSTVQFEACSAHPDKALSEEDSHFHPGWRGPTCDGDAVQGHALDRAIHLGVAADARQHVLREPKALQEVRIPCQCVNVHQERARRIRDICHMDAACVSSRW